MIVVDLGVGDKACISSLNLLNISIWESLGYKVKIHTSPAAKIFGETVEFSEQLLNLNVPKQTKKD